jgi:O-antigen/teichoic acid export membrane protein
VGDPASSSGRSVELPVRPSGGLRIAKESASVFLAQVVGLAFGAASSLLVAWMLGPEGKGLVYFIQFVASSCVIFLNLGLGPSAVYHLGRDRVYSEADIASALLWPSLLSGALPLVIMGALWPWVGHAASGKFGGEYLVMSFLAVPGLVLAWNGSYLELARGRIFSSNVLRVGPPAIFFVGLLALLFFSSNRSAIWVAAAWLVGTLLTALYAAGVISQTGAALNGRRLMLLRGAFKFGWSSHLGAVTQFLQHRVDIVLVSFLLPLNAIGIYSIAVAGSELLWYVPNAVAAVLMPHIALGSDEAANRMTSKFCRVIVALNAALALALALASTVFIRWALPAFRPSILPLWLLLPGVIAASVFKVLSSDFNGRGKPFETFRPAVISLCACLAAGLIVIPKFGVNGAALVTTGGYTLNTVLYIRAYSRLTSVSPAALLLIRRKDFSSLGLTLRTMMERVVR